MTSDFARIALPALILAWPIVTVARGVVEEKAAATAAETPGLKATQVTIAIDKDGVRRKFQATVMSRKGDELTVLTVAHGISPDDVDGPAMLLADGATIPGKVTGVVRNPSYKPNPNREIPGPDNAVARIRLRPSGKAAVEAFNAIKAADGLASRSYPAPSGQTVHVRMIDQKGVEHALKAGNYSNPRFLEWGPSYLPIAGDSGSGVFAMSQVGNGKPPKAILIGIIVGRDDHGGMASLVSKELQWMADELAG